MLDTATVTSTSRTIDQTTGAEIVTSTTLYGPALAPYFGKCKVQSGGTQEANPEAGGATITVQRERVDFPVGSFAPAIGLVVTIQTAALDPLMVGLKFRVVALLHKSAATAYRLAVSEVV